MSNDVFKDSSLSFQPIVSLESGEVARYEALSRFDYFAPFDVQRKISFIESNGLATELDKRILHNIRMLLEDLSFFNNLPVNINITGESLSSSEFFVWIKPFVQTIPNPSFLGIEITETLPITNMKVCQETIDLLSEHGVRVYLDDIGSGHMDRKVVNILNGYNGLKIDGSIINQWAHSIAALEMTQKIVAYAKEHDLSVTAEFLDSKRKIQKAEEFGIAFAQGFKLGQPLPFPENPWVIQQRLKDLRGE